MEDFITRHEHEEYVKRMEQEHTELAKEVIAGKWGNGSDRKNRLTQAGYDYAAVQAKVNELMK